MTWWTISTKVSVLHHAIASKPNLSHSLARLLTHPLTTHSLSRPIIAIAFHSLNGTELFTKILSFSPPPKSPHFPQFTLCQAEACRVLGIVVQNNEKIQKDIATFPPANNPIFAATSLYNRCTTPSLLPTIISSISRMIRGSELLEGTFLSSPELSSLLDIVSSHLLASPQAKLTRVTVFFIRALATSDFTTDYEFLTENSLQLLKTAAFPAGGGATDTDMLESGASFWHQVLRQGGQNFDPKTNPPSTLPHFVAVRKLCVSLKNSVTLNLLDTARLALLSEGEHYEVYLEELRSVVELLVENDFDSPMDMKVQQQVQGGKTDSDLGIVQDFNDVKQHKNNNSNSKSPKEMTVTNEWQKIPEGMSVPKGCEFKMNFSTGVNEVRALQGQGENNNNQQIVVIDEV